MGKQTFAAGFSDYDYDIFRVASVLEIDEFIAEDEQLKKIKKEFGAEHYLTKRREREIINEFLLPLLEKLPKVVESGEKVEAEEGGTSLDLKGIDEDEARRTIDQLMRIGLCNTKGRGYKAISAQGNLMEKLEGDKAVNAVRGGELRELVESMMQQDKIDLARATKRQGIDFSPGWTKKEIENTLKQVGEDDESINKRAREEEERKGGEAEESLRLEVKSLRELKSRSRSEYKKRIEDLRSSIEYSDRSREILKRLGEKEKGLLARLFGR